MLGPGVAVVLSSAAAIRELMDKRSGSTPDRPANYMAMQVAGGLNMVLAHYCKHQRSRSSYRPYCSWGLAARSSLYSG